VREAVHVHNPPTCPKWTSGTKSRWFARRCCAYTSTQGISAEVYDGRGCIEQQSSGRQRREQGGAVGREWCWGETLDGVRRRSQMKLGHSGHSPMVKHSLQHAGGCAGFVPEGPRC
jgi:hypothetical protein